MHIKKWFLNFVRPSFIPDTNSFNVVLKLPSFVTNLFEPIVILVLFYFFYLRCNPNVSQSINPEHKFAKYLITDKLTQQSLLKKSFKDLPSISKSSMLLTEKYLLYAVTNLGMPIYLFYS